MPTTTVQRADALESPSTPPSTPSVELVGILTPEELEGLRRGFSPEGMIEPSRQTLVGAFPPIQGYANSFLSYFFSEAKPASGEEISSLSPLERERILITLQVLRMNGNGRFLAIHLYWGLMTGLSVQQIADQLFLIGVYAGLSCYTAAIATFQTLLRHLKQCVASGDVQAPSILAATAQWFAVT
ncbi:carboxymuconolactone decarboxylase family protein [Stigmatella aurantiaca]|uniref:Uncharacterized protein n=1 Tax=Stigmatella aurantiaca (strain DW4/3-1) TaxID=378806 RepID=Q095S9_STIAD|nr:carboxymuconolactone decarboxylase family protein [Stigmatella aurantiaca]EAU67496.1 hypothetical protein STIAU_6948 [Stigmatella aurantiaca DW4/3-1]